MFKDKSTIRLKAMDAMMKDKPSVKLEAKPDPMDMGEEKMEEGMISMPVTMEEKAMIEAMREEGKSGGAAVPGMEAEEKAAY